MGSQSTRAINRTDRFLGLAKHRARSTARPNHRRRRYIAIENTGGEFIFLRYYIYDRVSRDPKARIVSRCITIRFSKRTKFNSRRGFNSSAQDRVNCSSSRIQKKRETHTTYTYIHTYYIYLPTEFPVAVNLYIALATEMCINKPLSGRIPTRRICQQR